jgi:hypothetical protein
MIGDTLTVAQIELEHAARERVFRRAYRDAEQAWLGDPRQVPLHASGDRRDARRALQALVLAVLGRS